MHVDKATGSWGKETVVVPLSRALECPISLAETVSSWQVRTVSSTTMFTFSPGIKEKMHFLNSISMCSHLEWSYMPFIGNEFGPWADLRSLKMKSSQCMSLGDVSFRQRCWGEEKNDDGVLQIITRHSTATQPKECVTIIVVKAHHMISINGGDTKAPFSPS